MKSDTDGPNRLPGKSRLTLLRSNTGMSSVGLVVACRATCRTPRVLDELALLDVSCAGGSRVRQELCPAVPGSGGAARAPVDGCMAVGRLHVAPFYATWSLSIE